MSEIQETNLSGRMRRLHQEGTRDLPDNWLDLADKFDAATHGFFNCSPATVDVSEFMGCFARARRAWCDITGEPLV